MESYRSLDTNDRAPSESRLIRVFVIQPNRTAMSSFFGIRIHNYAL
jgi:hypothetical protein